MTASREKAQAHDSASGHWVPVTAPARNALPFTNSFTDGDPFKTVGHTHLRQVPNGLR